MQQDMKKLTDLFGDFHDSVISEVKYSYPLIPNEKTVLEIILTASNINTGTRHQLSLKLTEIIEINFKEFKTSNSVIYAMSFLEQDAVIFVDLSSTGEEMPTVEEIRKSHFYVACRNISWIELNKR